MSVSEAASGVVDESVDSTELAPADSSRSTRHLFSVMHGRVQFLVHGQARSGGSAHVTENPSRSTFGSSFTRPPI